LLIDRLAFSPIAGADDADASRAPGEPDRHDAVADPAETEEPLLGAAVLKVLGDDTTRIEKAYCANANAPPCLTWFDWSLASSHSNVGSVTIGMEDKPYKYMAQDRRFDRSINLGL